jgi:hypothetical protein
VEGEMAERGTNRVQEIKKKATLLERIFMKIDTTDVKRRRRKRTRKKQSKLE